MTVLNRGARSRRGGRRPGWSLLTALLVLAILASSALVFTDRVELLKLAVILALWAAVVAAFVSVIYRRQSDVDQAKARDLKLVYDLQLDREISARREYELTVESQLRRELASELRAQSADEVAALRAELSALRTSLEILFDTDLSHRPAIETERTTVRAYSDWARDAETTGRVTASRIEPRSRNDYEVRTEESPIIDVAAEPHPPEDQWAESTGPRQPAEETRRQPEPAEEYQGRRRLGEDTRGQREAVAQVPDQPPAEPRGRRRSPDQQPPSWPPPPAAAAWPPPAAAPPAPEPEPVASPPPRVQQPAPPGEPRRSPEPEPAAGWQPAPAEGQWIPAGAPGSNWASPVADNGAAGEYVGRRRAPEPTMSPAPTEAQRGRHSAPPEVADPGRPPSAPAMAPPQPAAPPPQQPAAPPEPTPARHGGTDDEAEVSTGQHTGGQSVADLLARLQVTATEGGRRRRREE